MIDYKDLKDLFQLLKVKSVSKKHWFDTSGWGMAEVMHVVLLEATKATFDVALFIAVNVDEVTMIDNTQWLSIHLYVVQKLEGFMWCGVDFGVAMFITIAWVCW